MNFIPVLLLSLVLTSTYNTYDEVEIQAHDILAFEHQEKDSMFFCNDKMKLIVLRDTVINKPGQTGTEYNYPIYQYETHITYYKNNKLASFEKLEIYLKPTKYQGVTTSIQKVAVLDSLHSYYFDQAQQEITHAELMALQDKLCN